MDENSGVLHLVEWQLVEWEWCGNGRRKGEFSELGECVYWIVNRFIVVDCLMVIPTNHSFIARLIAVKPN